MNIFWWKASAYWRCIRRILAYERLCRMQKREINFLRSQLGMALCP